MTLRRGAPREVSSCDEVRLFLIVGRGLLPPQIASHFGRGGTRKRDGEGHASLREGGGTACRDGRSPRLARVTTLYLFSTALSPNRAPCAAAPSRREPKTSVTERGTERRKRSISVRVFGYCALSPDFVGSSPKGRADFARVRPRVSVAVTRRARFLSGVSVRKNRNNGNLFFESRLPKKGSGTAEE